MMIVVDGKQSWLKQPGYAEVNPGESVVLDCHIANKEGDCRWKWHTLMIITYPLDKWRKSCNLVMAKVTPKLPNFENHFDKVPHYGILTSFFAIYQKVFFFLLLHSGRELYLNMLMMLFFADGRGKESLLACGQTSTSGMETDLLETVPCSSWMQRWSSMMAFGNVVSLPANLRWKFHFQAILSL